MVVLILLTPAAVRPQPAAPPPPPKYKVELRYDIPAPRDQHVALYKAMVVHLEKVGFAFDPPLRPFPNSDYEDRGKDILTGSIAPEKVLACFDNRSVASLLLVPSTYQLPAGAPVRVRLELASGLPAARQFMFANQVRALLGQLGFKESVGYDHHGYTGRPFTRLVGTIPVENLDMLVKDLRTQPTGWLMPRIDPQTLPAPISEVVPIKVTEVLPEPATAEDAPLPPKRGQDYLDKIGPGLWTMLTSKDDDTKIVRAEIILSYVPAAGDESYRGALLKEAPSLFIEGRLGPVVTALLRVNQANALAGLSQVSVVRLARPALVQVDPSIQIKGDNASALKQSGLEVLHQAGSQGQGIRVGIIDSDFRGYADLIQRGQLPKSTRFVDLTTEFNPDLYPDPQPGDAKSLGHGAHCALAAALAAPRAELTLIRIDPTSLLQLQLVARVVNGEFALDDHLTRRHEELQSAKLYLARRQAEFFQQRKAILDNFEDDSEAKRKYEILGPVVRGWLFTPREWMYRREAELERENELLQQLDQRFQRFHGDLQQLKGLHIVCTSLVWNDGYPLAGGSPLSQWFDDDAGRKSVWFVSAGNSAGQSWVGPYRDDNGNGVMEFAPAGSALPAGSWTPEVNFLSWQPYEAPSTLELPAGATVRVTAQWREPHDPSYAWKSDDRDRYLKPLAGLSLVVLHQRDPSGKAIAVDDFEVSARSPAVALRIENQPTGSTYEHLVEFKVAKAGQYALRVQKQLPTAWELREDSKTGQAVLIELRGLTATGIRPADVPTLPALQSHWELWPRIFVNVIDPETASKGRVIFRDFSTSTGSIPILADTRSLIAVGAASLANVPQPYTAIGTPGTLWSFNKPNVLAYDSLTLTPPGTGSAYGSSLATPFAAGMAATYLSTGKRPWELRDAAGANAGDAVALGKMTWPAAYLLPAGLRASVNPYGCNCSDCTKPELASA